MTSKLERIQEWKEIFDQLRAMPLLAELWRDHMPKVPHVKKMSVSFQLIHATEALTFANEKIDKLVLKLQEYEKKAIADREKIEELKDILMQSVSKQCNLNGYIDRRREEDVEHSPLVEIPQDRQDPHGPPRLVPKVHLERFQNPPSMYDAAALHGMEMEQRTIRKKNWWNY